MNQIKAISPFSEVCPVVLTGVDLQDFKKYFMDESKREGYADGLVFPRSTDEVAAAVRLACNHDWAVTVSGARTGIAAGAVPEGGLVVSLERMNQILNVVKRSDGTYIVRCQAGMRLQDLQKSLKNTEFANAKQWSRAAQDWIEQLRCDRHFFPPDPTETSASIGGIAACNASGAHTFRYGPARSYIEALVVVLADGSVTRVERGVQVADDENVFVLERADDHGDVRFKAPSYRRPKTKNAAGYYSGEHLDAVDLFVGSEGTLGVITEVDIRLAPLPETNSATVVFLPDEADALKFTRALRSQRQELGVEAIEYFDSGALAFMRRHRAEVGAASGVPECLPENAEAAVYLDIGVATGRLSGVVEQLIAVCESVGAVADECWSADEPDERERLRLFRHALPEAVNTYIASVRRKHPELTKLGTDMAVPDDGLEAVMSMYRSGLDAAELTYVIFGHIGDNHLHVNILPKNPDEYKRGKSVYVEFARRVVEMGGSPVAEHGIGKLKRSFLTLLVGHEGLAQMRAVKAALDPEGRLGPETLWEV